MQTTSHRKGRVAQGPPETRSDPRHEAGGHPDSKRLAQAAEHLLKGDVGSMVTASADVQTDSRHRRKARVAAAQQAAPRCEACGHDRAAEFRARLDAQDHAWKAGYRAASEWVADIRLGAFTDGWRAGLAAGAERGTAA